MNATKYVMVGVTIAIVIIAVAVIIIFIYKPEKANGPSTTPTAVTQQVTNSAENAENFELIKSGLEKEAITPDWTTSGCAYAVTATETDYQTVEIRELHDDVCGGDPNTSPKIETFRLTDGNVEWYDIRYDKFVPFGDYRHYLSL